MAVSVTVAMYALILYYVVAKEELEPYPSLVYVRTKKLIAKELEIHEILYVVFFNFVQI